MGKKYSFISFVTNPLTFTLTIKNFASSVTEFVTKYKTTYEFTAFVEKFAAAIGWVLRLKISKILISVYASLLSAFSLNLKVNKIRILISESGIFSFTETLRIKKFFINASVKATERWTQVLRIKKFVITNVFDELDRFATTNVTVKKIKFIPTLIVGILYLLSYYDNDYGDGFLDTMDASTLAQLEFSES